MKRILLTTALALVLAGPARAGTDPAPAASGAADIAAGRAVADAADCTACHTIAGGKPFAGGLPMVTPVGTIYSTNISPSARSGIGTYSYDEFARALKEGVAKDGHHLYPAMPYPSYARLTDADMKALYAYFMNGVEAVDQPNRPSDIPWPLSMRWPLAFWNAMFAPSAQPFKPVADHDAVWNRGAYLVEGAGHCGSCHTPRGLAFQEKALTAADGNVFLSGGTIDGWFAKSLRADKGFGLGDWEESEIVDFLKTGRTHRTAAFGGMTEVVTHSTQFMPTEDLMAMARYLKSLAPQSGPTYVAKAGDTTFDQLRAGKHVRPGASVYGEFCQSCHRADGAGVKRIFPALAGNSAVLPEDPGSLIRVVLAGGRMPVTESGETAYTMPGFTRLTDTEIAEVLTFVRSSWGNNAGPVHAADVASARKSTLATQPARP